MAIKGQTMTAPWKKNKTTLDKVEERVTDWLDQLKIEDRIGDIKEQIKDLNLDERAVDLKDQIVSSDLLSDIKEQIKSSERVDSLRDQVPGVKPAKKSKKRHKVLFLAVVGAGATAFFAIRRKATGGSTAPPAYSPPTYAPPKPAPTPAAPRAQTDVPPAKTPAVKDAATKDAATKDPATKNPGKH